MAKRKSSTAIYQLRAELCDIRPLIWRRLLVRGQATISDLHRVLQVAFGWYDEHLHRFDIFGQDYGEYREGGLMYSTDATKVRLSTLGLGPGDSFTYEYDFGDLWVHEIEVEDVLADVGANKTYPRCPAGMGVAPPEDCGGPLAAMQRYRRRAGRSSKLLDDDWDCVDVDPTMILMERPRRNQSATGTALTALASTSRSVYLPRDRTTARSTRRRERARGGKS